MFFVFMAALPVCRAQNAGGPPGAAGQQGQKMRLTLKQAVDLALSPDGSPRVQLAQELIRQSEARLAQARAPLLPNIDGAVSQQNRTTNLAAFGLSFQIPVPGFSFPRLVGPFSVFDARATGSQTFFDLSAIRRYQASKKTKTQSEAERDATEDQVRAQVARAYLGCVRAQAGVEAAQANVTLAQALVKQANDRKNEGTATEIDVTRAQVQVANARQVLLVAQNEHHRSTLQLLRTIGLDLNVTVEIAESLSFLPVQPIAPQEALQTAFELRPDWKADQLRREAANLNYGAVKAERLPSVTLFGDYGSSGTTIDYSIPTRTLGVSMRVPVFDGGRRDARRAESASLLRQQQIQSRDLRAQIELDVRLALDNLVSAAEQVKVAEEGLTLAQDELAHAQRRFAAGITTSVEVTDAQSRLERARENRIAALFNHNQARLELGAATGTISQMIQ
jgi:outer membrane protein TolC